MNQYKQCFGQALEFWFLQLDLSEIPENEARLIGCFGPPINDRSEKIQVTVKSPVSIGLTSD